MTAKTCTPSKVWTFTDDSTNIIVDTYEEDCPVVVNRQLDLFEGNFEVTVSCSNCAKLFRTLANRPAYTQRGYFSGSVSVVASLPHQSVQQVQPGITWTYTAGDTTNAVPMPNTYSATVSHRNNGNVGIGTASPSVVWDYKWHGDVDADCPHCDHNKE